MPRGTVLSPQEQGQISAMKKDGCSNSQIAKTMKRSRKVVRTFLRSPATYGTKKKTGRPSKLSAADKRRLLREARKGEMTAHELRKSMNLAVSDRTVRRVLHGDPELRYKKMAKSPQ